MKLSMNSYSDYHSKIRDLRTTVWESLYYCWRLKLKLDTVTYVVVSLRYDLLQRGVTPSCPDFSPNLEISLVLGRRSYYRRGKNENYIALRLWFGADGVRFSPGSNKNRTSREFSKKEIGNDKKE
jgi:hypothetical protein